MPLPKLRFKGLGPSPEAGPFKLPSGTRAKRSKTAAPMKTAKHELREVPKKKAKRGK